MTDAVRGQRLAGVDAESTFTFFVDGDPVEACAGETIGGAMLLAGRRTLRRTTRGDEPRGLYCVMGVCWECAVRVEGRTVRACLVPATPGLAVETLRGGPA
jgi:aerobic-type carbon monoxide dehydrogenase small subunit (CoxS/CutS family)